MDTGLRQILLFILAGVIALGAITYSLTLFRTGLEYNRVVVENTHHKASSRYLIPDYYSPVLYQTPTESFSDIIAGDYSVSVQINGHEIDPVMLTKARGNEEAALAALKAALNQSKYHKVSYYNGNGTLYLVNYIGE